MTDLNIGDQVAFRPTSLRHLEPELASKLAQWRGTVLRFVRRRNVVVRSYSLRGGMWGTLILPRAELIVVDKAKEPTP